MKTTIKILTGISILFLLLGSAAAFAPDDLKAIDGYTDFKDSYSNYTTNSDRFFNIEKVTLDDALIQDYFTNSSQLKYTTFPAGDNIWYYADDTFELYGYQEIVNIDGDNYMVSINQGSKLSPSEKNEFLKDLKELNQVNNLEVISVT